MTGTALDYDPPKHAREWVRHVQDGQLGWKVTRNGKAYVKYDRATQVIEVLYRETDWIDETEHRPLTRWAIAKIAYQADRELCRALGEIAISKREWIDLRVEEKQRWLDHGPVGNTPEHRIRQGLFTVVMAQLAPIALQE